MNDMYDAFGDDCNETLATLAGVSSTTPGNSFMALEDKSINEFLTRPEIREFLKNVSINLSICNFTKLMLNFSKNTPTSVTDYDDTYDDDDDSGSGNSDIIVHSIITICYAIIFIAGILGNLITCIVISRNKFMHTATNFYLFNLAVSDLILLLSGECFLHLYYVTLFMFPENLSAYVEWKPPPQKPNRI